jgi:hypothetical protein
MRVEPDGMTDDFGKRKQGACPYVQVKTIGRAPNSSAGLLFASMVLSFLLDFSQTLEIACSFLFAETVASPVLTPSMMLLFGLKLLDWNSISGTQLQGVEYWES